VGEFEQAIGLDGVAEVEDIEVDHSWGVPFGAWLPAQMEFDRLSGIEEFVWAAGKFDFNDGIVEIRRFVRAGDRRGLVDGGLEVLRSGWRYFTEKVACRLQVQETASEI
jgi:hypothetical protein